MAHTILSAQYSNPDHTAAVLTTQEAGAVLASQADTPALWTQMLAAVTPAAYVAPSAVPQEVSRAQAKIALLRAGLLLSVEAAVAAAGGEVSIWYADALNWRRDNPNVNSLGASLGLSSDGIDALFIQAAQIEA